MVPVNFKIETLINIIGSDEKVMQSLLEDLVKGSDKTFAQMVENFDKKNWNSLRNNAHFLKSNFRYLGNQQLMNVLKAIELNSPDESKRDSIIGLMHEFESGYPIVMNEVKEYINYLKVKV